MFKYWCLSKTIETPHPEGGFTVCDRKCDYCNSKGEVIVSEEDKYVCPHTGAKMKLAGPIIAGLITKLTESQIKTERKKRSHDDFKKNILPTIDKDAKRHHIKKDISLKKFI